MASNSHCLMQFWTQSKFIWVTEWEPQYSKLYRILYSSSAGRYWWLLWGRLLKLQTNYLKLEPFPKLSQISLIGRKVTPQRGVQRHERFWWQNKLLLFPKPLNNPVVYIPLENRNLKGLFSVFRSEEFKITLQDFSSNPIFSLWSQAVSFPTESSEIRKVCSEHLPRTRHMLSVLHAFSHLFFRAVRRTLLLLFLYSKGGNIETQRSLVTRPKSYSKHILEPRLDLWKPNSEANLPDCLANLLHAA